MMVDRPPVLVTHYTDPWSVWCWAIEPQLLRLRERHGSAIRFQWRIGAILETPVPPDFPRDDIVRMFHAAKRQSGMPLDPELVLKVHSGTTHRAGIAAKAVALADPERFPAFLRALREASQVDARDIETIEIQEEIARGVGVDVSAFKEALDSEEAKREFYSDQAEARMRGITGFPTVTFKGPIGQEVAVSGFQPSEAYEAGLARVSEARWVDSVTVRGAVRSGLPPAAPPPDVRALLHRVGPRATAEIAEVYDWLDDDAAIRLLELERKGVVKRRERAGGWFWAAR